MAINPVGSAGIISVLRQINVQGVQAARAAERISSGFRINRAADDPAGITRVARSLAQIGGLSAATVNTQTGISMVQTAEGGLTEIQSLVEEIRTSAIAAQNGALTSDEIEAIQTEVAQAWAGIQDTIDLTKFNTQPLLEGGSKTFQTGPDAGQTVTVALADAPTILTDLETMVNAFVGTDPTDSAAVRAAAANLETEAGDASGDVSTEISRAGAVQNRFEATLNTLNAMSDATTSALSVIRDADLAEETVNLARAQLLQETGIAVLAQLNAQRSLVTKLLE